MTTTCGGYGCTWKLIFALLMVSAAVQIPVRFDGEFEPPGEDPAVHGSLQKETEGEKLVQGVVDAEGNTEPLSEGETSASLLESHGPSQEVEFGGTHKRKNIGRNWYGQLVSEETQHPELVHTLVCSDSSLSDCKECTTKKDCWHGTWDNAYDGTLSIDVKKKGYYVAEVYMNCPQPKGADLKLYALSLSGTTGTLEVLLNSQKRAAYTKSANRRRSVQVYNGATWRLDRGDIEFTLQKFDGSNKWSGTVRVVLENTQDKQVKASVLLDAEGIGKATEACMDHQECLDVFAKEGSHQDFKLRSSIEAQEQCLQGKDSSSSCQKFNGCLKQDRKTSLLNYFSVAMGKYKPPASRRRKKAGNARRRQPNNARRRRDRRRAATTTKTTTTKAPTRRRRDRRRRDRRRAPRRRGSRRRQGSRRRRWSRRRGGWRRRRGYGLLEVGSNTSGRSQSKGCFDPAVSDPEALECDCMSVFDSWKKTDSCKADGEQACMTKYLCGMAGICKSWRNTNCPESLAQIEDETENASVASLLQDRSSNGDSKANLGSVVRAAALDKALGDKCVEGR